MTLPLTLPLRFHQTAFVVRDLDAAVRHWADDLGIGPWNVWTMRPPELHDTVYHGERVAFGLRHAMAFSGDLQIELVQPLEGPSIFTDQLETTGEGANHIGAIVDDHAAASADLIGRGFVPLQSARFGASEDGLFAYFQPPGIPTIVELIRPPTERFAPEDTYPKS
ncbi:VOC family protein [Microbacterium sp. STN6]|uniref:VOC family protein n=1 Tax=Microbacterium sp. STN6 TaxID=2995588 RepID=UPI00226100C6|nr:VOC family protein [Microbacterium sp. STN6]MCX7522532.1 VOC family protein [Microbacterium sp. STN6]